MQRGFLAVLFAMAGLMLFAHNKPLTKSELNNVQMRLEARIGAVDKKIDRLSQQVQALNEKMDRLGRRFAALEKHLNAEQEQEPTKAAGKGNPDMPGRQRSDTGKAEAMK